MSLQKELKNLGLSETEAKILNLYLKEADWNYLISPESIKKKLKLDKMPTSTLNNMKRKGIIREIKGNPQRKLGTNEYITPIVYQLTNIGINIISTLEFRKLKLNK